MKLLQKVIVKQILTENSKQNLFNRFHTQKEQLKKEIEQLKFQAKKMEKTKNRSSSLLDIQFDKEQAKRLEKIQILDFKIEQLHKLPIGSELFEKELEAIIEVNIGDQWEEITRLKTIVIKDGVVIDIF